MTDGGPDMPSIDLASMKYGQELLKRGFATMQEGGVIMDVVDAGPVSYTHLTLPTIE